MTTLNDILEYIVRSDDAEITEIIRAVIRRYRKVHPDWEIHFLSLPKHDPEARRRTIDIALALLEQAK